MENVKVRRLLTDEDSNVYLLLEEEDLAAIGIPAEEISEEPDLMLEVFDDDASATGKSLCIRRVAGQADKGEG